MLNHQSRYAAVALAVTATLLVGQAALADLITDGGFEDGTRSGFNQWGYAAGAPAASSIVYGHWLTTGHVGLSNWHTDIMNGRSPDLSDQVALLHAVAGYPATLSQTVSGLAAETFYKVSFYVNAGDGRCPAVLKAFVDGTEKFSESFINVEGTWNATRPFYSRSFTFKATSASQTLKFLVPLTAGDLMVFIDGVSMESTPDPGTFPEMVTGGGFEDGTRPGFNQWGYAAGAPAPSSIVYSHWLTTGHTGLSNWHTEITNGRCPDLSDQLAVIQAVAGYPGTLSQTISGFVPGFYQVSFYANAADYRSPAVLKVLIDDTEKFSESFTNLEPSWNCNLPFHSRSFIFRATRGSHILKFLVPLITGDQMMFVDGVSMVLVGVPAPGTLSLLGAGLAGLLACAWRTRR